MIIIIIIIIIKNECHSNIIVDRLQGCGKVHLVEMYVCVCVSAHNSKTIADIYFVWQFCRSEKNLWCICLSRSQVGKGKVDLHSA